MSSDSVRHLSNSEEFVANGNEGTFEETSMPVVDYYRARNQRLDFGSTSPNTANMADAPQETSSAPTSATSYANMEEQSFQNGGMPQLGAPVT